VTQLGVIGDDFDPRRHARSRIYEYRIWNLRPPSVFWGRYAWHIPTTLDVEAMACAASDLRGRHDLESFRGSDPRPVASTIRHVLDSRVSHHRGLITYRIEATAFLKHTVRNVVGTLVEIGSGRRSATGMPELLAARDRRRAAPTAPACGLVLLAVRYGPRASDD